MRSRSTHQSQASRSARTTVAPRACSDSRSSVTESSVRFSSEAQLISAVWELFSNPASDSWAWLRELNSPSGIADLVAVSLTKGWQQHLSIGNVPPRWLYPLKSLPIGEEFDGKEFALRFGISHSCANSLLTAFARAGYCDYQPVPRRWMKIRDPIPVADRIVAVEAKLRNWRRALYQAVQYASYAFEAWVVLDGASLHSASIHVDEFEKRGIGLMGLTAKGHSEILAAPNARPPRSQERFWHANAEIARRLSEEGPIVSSKCVEPWLDMSTRSVSV